MILTSMFSLSQRFCNVAGSAKKKRNIIGSDMPCHSQTSGVSHQFVKFPAFCRKVTPDEMVNPREVMKACRTSYSASVGSIFLRRGTVASHGAVGEGKLGCRTRPTEGSHF